ncbi:response regulator [Telluribacter sp. SYSU D00476]|uniref:response regulator n=1 Tax=Telluribacter sp. SYSU D00476 TaxID=2811430 RepID=UPI001FF23E00|nr:response regulator [Telluribacter sp. SYSU D00476]
MSYIQKPIRILLVEDNEGDIVLTKEALSEGKIRNTIIVARDGVEATELLSDEDFELPDLILLDMNLPRMDGKEVLSYIKHNNRLRRIPVIILTTSSSEKDIKESYDNQANCFISKPVDLDKFIKIIRNIEDFWISIVQLPTH